MMNTFVRAHNLTPWHISRLIVYRGLHVKHRTLCGWWVGIYRTRGEWKDTDFISDTCDRCLYVQNRKKARGANGAEQTA